MYEKIILTQKNIPKIIFVTKIHIFQWVVSIAMLIFLAITSLGVLTGCATLEEQSARNRELVEVIREGNIERAKKLIESGANPNFKTPKTSRSSSPPPVLEKTTTYSPLTGFQTKSTKAVVVSGGEDVLAIAIENDQIEIAKELINAGARVNVRFGTNKYTHLTYAIMYDNPEIIRLLLDAGANPNKAKGKAFTPAETPYSYALTTAGFSSEATDRIKAAKILKMLKKAGAEITQENHKELQVALDNALELENEELITILLELGASSYNALEGALLSAALSKKESDKIKSIEVVKMLKNAGADPTIHQRLLDNALFFAVSKGHYQVARQTLELGANPNGVELNNETAFSTAEKMGDQKVLDLFAEFGIKKIR